MEDIRDFGTSLSVMLFSGVLWLLEEQEADGQKNMLDVMPSVGNIW
jgi:high-affinity Fe2+/Pb2+ permease